MKTVLIIYCMIFAVYKIVTNFLANDPIIQKFMIFLLGPAYFLPNWFINIFTEGQARRNAFRFFVFLGRLPWIATFSLRKDVAYTLSNQLHEKLNRYTKRNKENHEGVAEGDWCEILDTLKLLSKLAEVAGLQNIISRYVSKPDKHLYAEIYLDLDKIERNTYETVKSRPVWRKREELFQKIFWRQYSINKDGFEKAPV